MVDIVDAGSGARYDHVAQSMALDRLRWIDTQLARKSGGNAETVAHRQHVRYDIERGLDEPSR